ncbi:hypothetical protein [Maritalea porphyrae]|uniref:hypothetical protein n=1 Tax=Maritalea porphyrae TaxID=880732 RepID=UPI0022AF7964|nr:hypothetical protein [Maritalea porphyrae]MCZ4272024.1 hypothetical protein [Maritalea porphyrae]
MRSINNYSKWIQDILTKHLEEDTSNKKVLCLVTIECSFRKTPFVEDGEHSSGLFRHFQLLYNKFSHKTLGRNYHRASHRSGLSLAIACIDVEGSKYGWISREYRNPHIHAIWAIPESQQLTLEDLCKKPVIEFSKNGHNNVYKFNFEKIETATKTEMNRVTNYITKFLPHNESSQFFQEDIRICPI